ncbi:hypothetical protein ASG04_08095 [Curtobacterium sp. Leaf183]|uniref:hypothetical protein n=1 Tax=Curtobacterium sp. Leaf183 TaxID=1736291 RepID=UPI0006F89FC2|nr:hypothetical protein [Curtobacterium sp. Leaf183]KQS08876.1 hypothetical protein ASG04_08095 [Curtobacterium sp. Leaf183]
MKYINYDGSVIMTGDRIAEALADYAAVLGANGKTDTVHVPTVGSDGSVETATVLVGPASELVLTPAPDDELDIEDPQFIRRLRDAAALAGPDRPLNADGRTPFAGADGP